MSRRLADPLLGDEQGQQHGYGVGISKPERGLGENRKSSASAGGTGDVGSNIINGSGSINGSITGGKPDSYAYVSLALRDTWRNLSGSKYVFAYIIHGK